MGKLNITKTSIEGLVIIEPTVFGDERGFLFESYSKHEFGEMGITDEFVQDNHSKSTKGVLRGLHFQREQTQGKLVRVIAGSVLDVAVDLRPESPTFGRWESVVLSAKNKRMFLVPKQFAHGFLTLEENTEFVYKCTDYYNPSSDYGVAWNDPDISIDWQCEKYGINQSELIISAKDSTLPLLKNIDPKTLWK